MANNYVIISKQMGQVLVNRIFEKTPTYRKLHFSVIHEEIECIEQKLSERTTIV